MTKKPKHSTRALTVLLSRTEKLYLREEAQRRGWSISLLIRTIIKDYMATATVEGAE